MSSTQLPDNFDPKDDDRSWYRHGQTGERGYAVRRDGKAMIRLDRPHQEILRRLNEDWVEEDASRPITPIHVAKVCFEADKALCSALGLMEHGRADWAKLTDGQRQAWITTGPKRPAARVVLYAGLKSILGRFCGGG